MRALLATILLLLAGPTLAQQDFKAVPGSTLAYHLVHKLHTVTGTSKSVEGRARVLPDGTVQVAVRAPLDSFDSGNANRDAHMLEATGAAQSPYVSFKGVGSIQLPSTFPADLEVPLRGELTLKTPRPIDVPIHLHFDSAVRVSVSARFPVSLEEHQVERPSLVFVKVDDRIEIDAKLRMEVAQ
jgi:hypothetical protein